MINPFKSKKGLGRGLSSLIGDSDIKASNDKISISSIVPNKNQPRKIFEKDLNAIEEAESYKNLIENFEYDQDKVSKFIGKSRSHITNSLRLLTLPERLIEMIRHGKLSQGHAKILIGLENSYLLAERIIKKKLSVRQTESLVRLLKNKPKKESKIRNANTVAIENDLTEKIGMRVFLNIKKNNSGTLTFNYKGVDQLDRLISVIKKNY